MNHASQDLGGRPPALFVLSSMQICPPIFGGQKRPYYILKGFVGCGWEVKVLSDEVRAEEWNLKRPVVIREDGYTEFRCYNPLFRPLGSIVKDKFQCSALFKLIKGRFLSIVPPAFAFQHGPVSQVLMIDEPFLLPLAERIRQPAQMLVHLSQNIEYKLGEALLEKIGNFPPTVRRSIVRALFALEKAAFQRAHLSFVCSEPDRQFAIRAFHVSPERVVLAPNGADVKEFKPSSESRKSAIKRRLGIDPSRRVVFFVGKRYLPNNEAAIRIVRMAQRLRQNANILFVIGGTVSEFVESAFAVLPANVKLAREDELRSFFQCADIALNPVEQGGGTNVKLFEFMASGLATITTPLGARGIHDLARASLIISPAEEFAAHICNLCSRPDRLRIYGAQARSQVESIYDWQKIGRLVAEATSSAFIRLPCVAFQLDS